MLKQREERQNWFCPVQLRETDFEGDTDTEISEEEEERKNASEVRVEMLAVAERVEVWCTKTLLSTCMRRGR